MTSKKAISEHYFSKRPTAPLSTENITITLLNNKLRFTTASSVFSKGKADSGTIILIEALHITKETKRLLDLGCGYGIVGISLKKAHPELDITCSDVNERAVGVTQKNAKKNGVEIKTIQSNLFENIPELFDCIAVNLPQHAGKDLCFAMIEQSYEHLNEKGTFQAVARHQKGGKMLEKKMEEIFGNVEVLAKGSGFRVYCSKRKGI